MVLTSQLLATLMFVWVLAFFGFALWRRFVKRETTVSGNPWPSNTYLAFDAVTVIVIGFVMYMAWVHASVPF